MEEKYNMVAYEEKMADEWDRFVLDEAINGTFLQTRVFLSYHPADRFEDCSFVIKEGKKIVAVCPACEAVQEGKKVFISHAGSTYGGLIISSKVCRIAKLFQIMELVEHTLTDMGFCKLLFKQTPDIYCSKKDNLLDFCYDYRNYCKQSELNFFIDIQSYPTETIRNFDNGRRRWIKKCINRNMRIKELKCDSEIENFYYILTKNLKKYNKTPVHTYEELLLLKRILKKEISFWGVQMDGCLVAGTMLFLFANVNSVHTQYLAADPDFLQYSPMSFLYYSMIEISKKNNYKYLSWGIATDHHNNINWNLANTKESYGSVHGINCIYSKLLIDT